MKRKKAGFITWQEKGAAPQTHKEKLEANTGNEYSSLTKWLHNFQKQVYKACFKKIITCNSTLQ